MSGWRGVPTTGEGVDIMCSLIHGVTSLPKNQNLGRLSAARGHQDFFQGRGVWNFSNVDIVTSYPSTDLEFPYCNTCCYQGQPETHDIAMIHMK